MVGFRLTCDEAADEPPTVTKEKIPKLQCNISVTTNYLHAGILEVCLMAVGAQFSADCCDGLELGPED